MDNPPRLDLRGIIRRYGAVLANDGIDLTVRPGEIHALLGENGAGKSTLVRIIYGLVQPDAGTIAWEGQPAAIPDPNAARALGIGMVFQHFSLFETLTVAENIALGLRTPESIPALSARIAATAARYGLAVEPGRHVHHLAAGERQRVEILRCLLQEPRLLIMDEPTSVLTPQEAEGLFAMLRRLAAEGRSVLYIGHKLAEIRALCDRATVLRAGRVVASCDPRAATAPELAALMVGRDVPLPDRPARATGAPLLSLRGLSLPPDDPFGMALDGVSFDLHAGEIVGIAGVAGNGQSELLAAITGERTAGDGMVLLAGQPCGGVGVAARRRLGLAAVPEERLGRGAVAELSLAENALLTGSGGLARSGVIDFAALRRFAARIIAGFGVVAAGAEAKAGSLSGGNMQKFIIGREIGHQPLVLVAAHPSWGVDVGATVAIHQALLDLAAGGAGVLVVSEDLEELFVLCDRIAVLHQGRLSRALPVSQLGIAAVGEMMGGLHDAMAA